MVLKNRLGFTLIELSIVLVIIGLIVGGVLVGQTLISAAKQRKLISVHEEFKTAWMVFRDKYQAIPGDMPNATSIFGASAGPCPAFNNTSFTTGTCNGNGNRKIGWDGGFYGENSLIWHHLGVAGIKLSGVYVSPYYHRFFDESKVYSFLGSSSSALAELYAGPVWSVTPYRRLRIIQLPMALHSINLLQLPIIRHIRKVLIKKLTMASR